METLEALIRTTFIKPNSNQKLHIDWVAGREHKKTKSLNTVTNKNKFNCALKRTLILSSDDIFIQELGERHYAPLGIRFGKLAIKRIAIESDDEFKICHTVVVDDVRDYVQEFLDSDAVYVGANALAGIFAYPSYDDQNLKRIETTDSYYYEPWYLDWHQEHNENGDFYATRTN